MSAIDWSKAPEGFPVWVESHYKNDPSDWHVRVEKGYKDRNGGMWFDHQVEAGECTVHVRPEWNGEGLPPVGNECEVMDGGLPSTAFDWERCTILLINKGADGKSQVCTLDFRGDLAIYYPDVDAVYFRPVRTAEQEQK